MVKHHTIFFSGVPPSQTARLELLDGKNCLKLPLVPQINPFYGSHLWDKVNKCLRSRNSNNPGIFRD